MEYTNYWTLWMSFIHTKTLYTAFKDNVDYAVIFEMILYLIKK